MPLVGMSCSPVPKPGSKCTRLGQNTTLPKANKIAGNKVKADNIAKTIPMEAIGPSVLLDFRSLSSNVSSPAITVEPEAIMGSTAPLSARRVATHLSRSEEREGAAYSARQGGGAG